MSGTSDLLALSPSIKLVEEQRKLLLMTENLSGTSEQTTCVSAPEAKTRESETDSSAEVERLKKGGKGPAPFLGFM